MMYELIYDEKGTPSTLLRTLDNVFIPLVEDNSDFQSFKEWNSKQTLPIDYTTPVPVSVPVSLSTDSNVMIGDGVDDVLLYIKGAPNSTQTVNVMTGQTPSTLTVVLDENGKGEQSFSCATTPTKITFTCGDASCQVRSL